MSYQTFVEELFNSPSVLGKLQSFYRNDEWSVKTTQKLLKHAVLDVLTTDKAQTKDGGKENQQPLMDSKHSRQALDNDLMASIKSIAKSHRPTLTWDDVAGLENAKQELQITVEMPRRQPQLFSSKRKPCQFILLYGPPGTGKTHLARVLAAVTKSTPYILSTSDLTNMWVGNSARLVRLMFQQARDNKPSVIFFDEVDAVCGQREFSHTESHIEQKSELLAQMDGAKDDNTDVLFVGATNLPWNLDPAFLRRFEKKLYIPLPDAAARERMLEIELGEHLPGNFQQVKQSLINRTDGFSGSDIKRLVQETLHAPLRDIESAAYFARNEHNQYEACNQDDEGAIPMNWRQVPRGKLLLGTPLMSDFDEGFEKVKPSVAQKSLWQYEEWGRNHGTDPTAGTSTDDALSTRSVPPATKGPPVTVKKSKRKSLFSRSSGA